MPGLGQVDTNANYEPMQVPSGDQRIGPPPSSRVRELRLVLPTPPTPLGAQLLLLAGMFFVGAQLLQKYGYVSTVNWNYLP